MVVSSIVRISRLLPTYEVIKSGKTVALANKETLVTVGPILMEEAKKTNANKMENGEENIYRFSFDDE